MFCGEAATTNLNSRWFYQKTNKQTNTLPDHNSNLQGEHANHLTIDAIRTHINYVVKTYLNFVNFS